MKNHKLLDAANLDPASNDKKKAIARDQAVACGFEWLYVDTHTQPILTDIAAKGLRYGGLTVNQIELVRRIRSGEKSLGQLAEENAKSDFRGEVGKPITVELEVLATREHVSPYGVSTWHLMRDAGGNIYTSRGVAVGSRGEFIKATWTVRNHEKYKGARRTVLSRPRKVSAIKTESE